MKQTEKCSPEEQKTILEALRKAIYSNEFIGAIKAVRKISPGMGLAEAKEMMDKVAPGRQFVNPKEAYEKLIYELRASLNPLYTKAQFLSLVGHAYDTADSLFADPLEAVLFCLNNLKEKGGLSYAAMQAEDFIEGI